jgi:acyl carrier protein
MTSPKDEIRSAFLKAISETMKTPLAELNDNTQLIADLGAKSVDFVRIIGALEDELDQEIPFMEFRRKKTIGEAIEYLVTLRES